MPGPGSRRKSGVARKAEFLGDCLHLIEKKGYDVADIKRMMQGARVISYATFSRMCRSLTAQELAEIATDTSAGYYLGQLRDRTVCFYHYAGFEFIWALGGNQRRAS